MINKNYDPNDVAVSNGNIFGFPVSENEANLIIIPIPWDVTTSFGKGTAEGPEGILNISTQLDFYHPYLDKAWEQKTYMLPIDQNWVQKNTKLAPKVSEYISHIEEHGYKNHTFQKLIEEVNQEQNTLSSSIESLSSAYLKQNKTVGILGGEHSVPLGLIKALGNQYDDFGILQIDAHCDLRAGYEGFPQSHASIMHNALTVSSVSKLVQVGIRDASPEEMNRTKIDDRIECFTDDYIAECLFSGQNWNQICQSIIQNLPQDVYISFDIDGLTPDHCPNTGTPVPGGISFAQAKYLLWELKKARKKIIGFDLCEVSTSENLWDENVGARVLWELSCLVQ